LRLRKWLEFHKDYKSALSYHPGKQNVVANALTKSLHMSALMVKKSKLIELFGECVDARLCEVKNVEVDE